MSVGTISHSLGTENPQSVSLLLSLRFMSPKGLCGNLVLVRRVCSGSVNC